MALFQLASAKSIIEITSTNYNYDFSLTFMIINIVELLLMVTIAMDGNATVTSRETRKMIMEMTRDEKVILALLSSGKFSIFFSLPSPNQKNYTRKK